MGARLLVVDDEPRYVRIYELLLGGAGHQVVTATGGHAALDHLGRSTFDAVLVDLQMPAVDGLAVLDAARELDPDLPVIVVTGHGSVRSAVEAMRRGAFDYVEKPFDDAALLLQVTRALETRGLKRQNRHLRSALANAHGFHRILGGSAAIRQAVDVARRVAPTDAGVLLLGESGTGKELFARALHEGSTRATGPFVKLNCAAVPATLLEAELFGVERGAFTGADRARPGRLEHADGGTLFLDEVGELDRALQPKLLRALEERTVERLGGGQPRPIDVRFVAATNRDLDDAVRRGDFRVDLYHRLAVFPITLPPLRERLDDLATLAEHFVERLNDLMGCQVRGVSPPARALLAAESWPGNVRELANRIERAMILCDGDVLEPAHFASAPAGAGSAPADPLALPADGVSLDALEGSLLRQAMARAGGNKAHAAKLLGLTRNTLRYRLEKHGLG